MTLHLTSENIVSTEDNIQHQKESEEEHSLKGDKPFTFNSFKSFSHN